MNDQDDRDIPDNPWQTVLWDACISGNIGKVKEAIQNGADVNKSDDQNDIPLINATMWAGPLNNSGEPHGHLEVV